MRTRPFYRMISILTLVSIAAFCSKAPSSAQQNNQPQQTAQQNPPGDYAQQNPQPQQGSQQYPQAEYAQQASQPSPQPTAYGQQSDPQYSQGQYAPQENQANPPAIAARLSAVEGNVSFEPAGENQWSQATPNYTLTTGDRLYTDQGARAEIEADPFVVRMTQGTDLTVTNLNEQVFQLGLEQGEIEATALNWPANTTFEIDTPNGALAATAAGAYRVNVDPNYGTRVIVDSGRLEISGGGVDQTIYSGQAAELTGSEQLQVSRIGYPGRDSFDQWSVDRDRRLHDSQSARYVSRDVPGYEDLDQYGRWQATSQYGEVWYPTDVAQDWVPYRDGHWAWVSPWGWTWVDNSPWGFAPFHYGRWADVDGRWAWVPGPQRIERPVYAPALVAFVGGGAGVSVGVHVGNVGLAAWFPLGPSEPFIPWYHHDENYLNRVNVTNVRNVTNITNITNVSNINYVNRQVATTAVPAAVLQSGQPVRAHAVSATEVARASLTKAPVVTHPNVVPTRTAVLGGRPAVKAPPVRQVNLTQAAALARARQLAAASAQAQAARARTAEPPTRGTPPQAAARIAQRPNAAPPQANQQPQQNRAPQQARGTAPPPLRQMPPPARANQPPGQNNAPQQAQRPAPPLRQMTPQAQIRNVKARTTPVPPRPSAPPLVTRRAPPPPAVPFARKQPALKQNPGRPLTPEQVLNLRAGRPAGPPRNQAAPPQPATRQPARGRPSPQQSKPTPKPNQRQKNRQPPPS